MNNKQITQNVSNPSMKKSIIINSFSNQKKFDFEEFKEYRDLLIFLVWRGIRVIYAQTIMGFSWAVFHPLVQILIFTIVFGKVAKIDTDGIPYFLFSSVAIIPWNYLSTSATTSSQSLVANKHLLGKVYFPRYFFPLTPIFAKLLDFIISLIVIIAISIYYRVEPTWNLLLFPVFVIFMMSVSFGIGLWLSAMAIRFRDVQFAMPFFLRLLMYSAPIVYSASSIPERYRQIYSLNPIVGVIEGFRACLLGTPFEWNFIWPGMILSLILLISGYLYFKNMERIFVDVI